MATKNSINPAAAKLLEITEAQGISTAFSRAADMKPCPIGRGGACCRNCFLGPCRLTGQDAESATGVCGASMGTIAARNLIRGIAAGAAAHSDHGRDTAMTLIAAAKGDAPDYSIRDERKLMAVARRVGIETEGRRKEEIAIDVGNKALAEFGQQAGELCQIHRAPPKRQDIWRKHKVVPRGIDREIVETMHRTHMGVDQDPESLLLQGVRTALADGWGGSMWASDIQDILFGTPSPVRGRANLGVLEVDNVNVIIHGHEPILSEMIAIAASDPELIAYARSKGAQGITLAGICCTANEVLMRQGVPSAGNFLDQELAIATGAVEAMVVDVQCIMSSLVRLARNYHTKIITTSPKARIPGALHIEFDEHRAYETAKRLIVEAIDNFANRKKTSIPDESNGLVAGFSHEYISYMLGGVYRASFRALNDSVIEGRILGVAGVVGCNNPRVTHDEAHNYIARELIRNDVLVVQTGCGAVANAKYGLLAPEALEYAGPGLREVCEAVGIPPVLHLGSCVDNSRILTVLTNCVTEGGLGDDISDLPAVGIAPEWMSEKALSIGTYYVASGLYVLFGVDSPVGASGEVTRLMSSGWEEKFGGKLEFVPDPEEIVEKSLAHIRQKREALKLGSWAQGKYSRNFVSKLALLSGAVKADGNQP